MTFQKSVALFSAAFLFLSFSVLPALAILNRPSDLPPGRVSVSSPVAPTGNATPVAPTAATVTFVAPHHPTTVDDALRAAEIDHPQTSESVLAAADLTGDTALLSRSQPASPAAPPIERLPWFGEVEDIYAKGDVATVIDVATGIRLQIRRTGGHNHADAETVDRNETDKLLEVAGGEWNWTRRPVIVEIDGHRIAASMTCRPHAGRDDQPALETVRNRSGGYGTGINYDSVKGNAMDGHIDIHFYKSRTHSTNKVDKAHQTAIEAAFHSGL